MKHIIHHFAWVILGFMFLSAPFAASGQQDATLTADKILKPAAGIGTRYGARDPLHCESTKQPESGAPSAEQVKAYFISGFEHEQGTGTLGELYLTENVKVEIGKGRPYEVGDGAGDIDHSALVYPIRGSFTYYRCYPINSAHPAGKSSKKIGQPNAEGLCYKTTFGDWKVLFGDIRTRQPFDGYFPAPK